MALIGIVSWSRDLRERYGVSCVCFQRELRMNSLVAHIISTHELKKIVAYSLSVLLVFYSTGGGLGEIISGRLCLFLICAYCWGLLLNVDSADCMAWRASLIEGHVGKGSVRGGWGKVRALSIQ